MTIKNKNKRFAYLLTVFLGIGIFFLALPAQASWATDIFGGLISLIINALGRILVLVMQALVAVAQYSNFIHAPAISNGWSVVRDVCNMFFVLILLIIAFATILRVENYSYKKWLPKLILMAILINFSKTICGLLIDFAQIIMLTFVNAFKDMAAGNLITNLGITEILTLANDSQNVGEWEIAGAYVLGLIYILIALVVIVTMLAMLVMRIVMIWIYVVLSPAAYLMSAFPGGQKYSSQWWTEFSKNLIVGPVLAFFIWLSFVSLQTQNINTDFPVTGPTDSAGVAGEVGITSNGAPTAATEASTPGVFIKFVIAIGMLIGGLKISQEIGGAAGGIAGKGMSKITKGAAFAGGLATGALAFGGKKIKQGAGVVGMNLATKTKGTLGKVAASSNGWARYTGVRALATGGLVAINKHQKDIEEKAQKKIDSVKNAQVVARFAREGALTPVGKSVQRKAAGMMPSALGDPVKVADKLAGMGREDFTKLSDSELHAIGKTGATIPVKMQDYLEKNSNERGAFNRGVEKFNLDNPTLPDKDYVSGTDKNGNRITTDDEYGSYMNPTKRARFSPAEALDQDERLDRAGKYSTFYFKDTPKLNANATTKVNTKDAQTARGNGNLSINEFAREKSDTASVDFDKLNIKGIDKGTDNDNRNIRGINTGDPAMIKEISTKMVSMIDSELSKIKSKGTNINVGDQKRIDNLETAKNRFSNPGKIDNLSLVNSSAASYRMSDVKKSKIHEEVHGLGIEDENEARYVTQKVLDNKDYGVKGANAGRTDKETVNKIQSERTAGITNDNSGRPVDDVLKDEKTGTEESVVINTENIDKSIENFSKKMEEISQKFNIKPINGAAQADAKQPNFVYLFGSLKKAITKDNQDLAKKITQLGGAKASTPLEVKAISEQVSGDLNNK